MKNQEISVLLIGMGKEKSDIFSKMLENSHYKISSLSAKEKSLVCDKYSEFDCLIIDHSVWGDCMFNTDYEFFSNLNEAIPVIFTADQNNENNIQESFKKGADDFISFPCSRVEVSARIDNQIFLSKTKKTLISEMEKRTADLTLINSLLNESVFEYKQILRDLQENETLLLTIALNIPNSYLGIVERNYTIGFAAGQEFKKKNYDPWKLIGLPVESIFKDQAEFVKHYLAKTFNGEETSFELEFNNQYLVYKAVPLFNSEGSVLRILVVAENVTSQKISEDKIKESLKEKETLLKEIHHRVKNNMQLVYSMLSLQADSLKDAEVLNIFKVLQSRIYSMSLVHEKLYQHKQLSKINFKEYVGELVSEISKSFSVEPGRNCVTVEMVIHDESFTIEKAIPCGLILNELILNAYKHASLESAEGYIKIFFNKSDDGKYLLTVKDNGKGLPEGFDILKTESMGMMLVRELVGQLKGEISVRCDTETTFTIIFGGSVSNSEAEICLSIDRVSKNILLVEDERIISRMLRKIIEGHGYNIVDAVSTGREAIDSAGRYNPDLIIMDIMLDGEIDGVEAASEIIKMHSCPIVFLTGNSDPATLKSAYDINPFGMLTKPVERYNLINIIDSALKQV